MGHIEKMQHLWVLTNTCNTEESDQAKVSVIMGVEGFKIVKVGNEVGSKKVVVPSSHEDKHIEFDAFAI